MTSRSDEPQMRETAKKTWTRRTAGVALVVLLWTGIAIAQGPPGECDKTRTPDQLVGEVVKLDAEHGKVTLRAADGTMHEFQATKDVLQAYKVGDRIEAKLRAAPGCK